MKHVCLVGLILISTSLWAFPQSSLLQNYPSKGKNTFEVSPFIDLVQKSKDHLLWKKQKAFSPQELWSILDWQFEGGFWWEANPNLTQPTSIPSQALQAWVLTHNGGIAEQAYLLKTKDGVELHRIQKKGKWNTPQNLNSKTSFAEFKQKSCWSKACKAPHAYDDNIELSSDGVGTIEISIKDKSSFAPISLAEWRTLPKAEKKIWSLQLYDYFVSEYYRVLPSLLETIPTSFDVQNWNLHSPEVVKPFVALKESLLPMLNVYVDGQSLELFQIPLKNGFVAFYGSLDGSYRLVLTQNK